MVDCKAARQLKWQQDVWQGEVLGKHDFLRYGSDAVDEDGRRLVVVPAKIIYKIVVIETLRDRDDLEAGPG